MRISDWSSDVCSSDLDVGDGHGAEIEIGAVGHAQRSRTVVIVDVATIDAVGSECLLSVHKWLEGGDTRRDDHLRGAAVLAERQIEIVEDGEILQPVGWLDQQRGAEAVVVLVLEIAAAAEILDLSVAAVDPAGDAQRDLAVDDGHVERALQ